MTLCEKPTRTIVRLKEPPLLSEIFDAYAAVARDAGQGAIFPSIGDGANTKDEKASR